MIPPFPEAAARAALKLALEEDLGRGGDITTEAIARPEARAEAEVNARQEVVVAGLPLVKVLFELLCPGAVSATALAPEGSRAPAGSSLARLQGPAAPILSGERVLLNFLARMCAVATLTARAVAEIAGTRCRVADTRKTTPGLRALEKYAVAVGGGENHRFGLDSAVLLKDNHKALAGGLSFALERLWQAGHGPEGVEVEVDSLGELEVALEAGVSWVLLDNMSLPAVQEAVRRAAGRCRLEVSGGMVPGKLRPFAEAGVDRISLGCLTHGVPAVDLGLDFGEGFR